MIFTTKGRYAVMAMADIAENGGCNTAVKLADISKRQAVPISYLEQIFVAIKKAELVCSVRGPGGGYKLTKPACEITVLDIVQAVGEGFKISGCNPTGKGCKSFGCACSTYKFWAKLENHMHDFLESSTLDKCFEEKSC